MLDVLELLVPPGALRTRSRSGTPLILAVKAMEPATVAEMGWPDGARITERLSSMSTYSSFDVCRTFVLLHGMAGPLFRLGFALRADERMFEDARAGVELCMCKDESMGESVASKEHTLASQPV